MKNFLLVTIILVIVLFIKAINPDPNLTSSDPPSVLYYPSENAQPLDVAIVQDVSGSGAWNGIEKFNTSMLQPIYSDNKRPVRMSFIIASSMSAHSPISVELPAMTLKPRPFDLDKIPVEYRNRAKRMYVDALNKYAEDSVAIMQNRKRKFDAFCNVVSHALAPYERHLSRTTDLITAISIADKQLGYWHVPGAARYIILSSDGLDTHHRTLSHLTSNAQVLFVNAQRHLHTSIDSIIAANYATIPQAISFISQNN